MFYVPYIEDTNFHDFVPQVLHFVIELMDCHLCELAKEVIQKAKLLKQFEFREIKLTEGEERFEEFKERFPVIFIEKQFSFQYRVSEKELLSKLSSLALGD